MIFNRFFTPAHSSKDAKKRLAAVAKLSSDVSSERRVLHELAFNDEDPDVSLAALSKLDSFALWQKMSQIAANDKVKRQATQAVERFLLDGDGQLSAEEKKSFLIESANADLVVKALNQNIGFAIEGAFALSLLEKVGRQNVTQTFFLNVADSRTQLLIIEASQDTDLLQKLQRKSQQEIKAAIDTRLNNLVAAKNKPIVLEKDMRMVLAKLQAQLDKSEFVQVRDSVATLTQDYAALNAEIECIDVAIGEELSDKYELITQRLNTHMSRLELEYSAAQVEAQRQNIKQALASALESANAGVANLISDNINNVTMGEIEAAQQKVQQASELLEQAYSLKVPSLPTDASHRLQELQSTIDDFPNLQRKGVAVVEFLEAGEAYVNEQDNSTSLTPASALDHEQWRELKQSLPVLPSAWNARWREANKRLSAENKRREKRIDEKLGTCRRHISVVVNLISQGRFRPAMSRFSKLNTDFTQLDDSLKSALQKRFDDVKSQVERLQGWQSYIAAPRKPALLEEATKLTEQQAENISERAKAIKYLRSQWLSLGQEDSEEGRQQDKLFDQLLEEAFKPCREFYAQQDAQRNQAKKQRESLIESLRLLDTAQDKDTLHKSVEQLKKDWHDAGHVNADDYQRLKTKWDEALAEVTQVLFTWYQENKNAKLDLIEQVKGLLADELSRDAANTAQKLQKRWKEIGFSGRRQESRLWKDFRTANDAVFDALKSLRLEKKNEFESKITALDASIARLKSEFNSLGQAEQHSQLEKLKSEILSYPRKLVSAQHQAMDSLYHQWSKAQSKAKLAAKRAQVQGLVTVLEHLVNQDLESAKGLDAWEQLKRPWQNALAEGFTVSGSRLDTTIELELLLNVESPATDESRRKTLQLTMMTVKLEQGTSADFDALLVRWLTLDNTDSSVQLLLPRLEAVIEKKYIGDIDA